MTIYPFLQLSREDQSKLSKALMAAYETKGCTQREFAQRYTSALQVMNGKLERTQLAQEQEAVLMEFNWKTQLPQFINITGVCSMAAKGCFVGGAASAVLTALFMRSYKVIAVACGCSAVAWLVLRQICEHLRLAVPEYRACIEKMNWENITEFPGEIDQVYKRLEANSLVMKIFLTVVKRRLPKEQAGLELLKLQLSTSGYLNNLILRLTVNRLTFGF
jgi:hypothetical protein